MNRRRFLCHLPFVPMGRRCPSDALLWAQRARSRATRRALLAGATVAAVALVPACRDAPAPARPVAPNAAVGETRAQHAAHGERDDAHDAHDEHDDAHDAHAAHDDEHAHEIVLTPEAIERHGVRVERAALHKLRPTFIAPARVAFNAETMAHVGSPLPGRVVELHVRLGDVVAAGDTLLVVESPELGEAQSDYLQKRILAGTAVTAVELAQSSLDRARRLFEQNRGIALDEVQKREAEFKSAQAALQTAEAAAQAAENKLYLLGMDPLAVQQLRESGEVNPRFTTVAPLPGRVVEREVTLGELVSPEKEALIVLADTTELWVLADVPESRLPEVVLGAPAWIRSGVAGSHKHAGDVSYIAPTIDPRTRCAQVRVVVPCEHGALWPGMFVQAEITATDPLHPDRPPALAVPDEALQLVEGRPSLFVPVPGKPNAFARRPVAVGDPVGGLTPVVAGLAEGEPFVAAGSFILKAELGKAAAEHAH